MSTPSQFAEALRTPAAYRQWININAAGKLSPWASVAEPWQIPDMDSLDAALLESTGAVPVNPATKRMLYSERPRGHSKTTDIAIAASYTVAAARRVCMSYWIAEDSDQGKLAVDAINAQVRNTPGLDTVLEVNRGTVRNIAAGHPGCGSELRILAADSASSYGITPSAVFVDEFTHWSDPEMWFSVFSSAAKRPECLVAVISNAGVLIENDWRWRVRESARKSPEWVFSSLAGPHASWITPAMLEQQKLMLPGATFRRLWLNEWISGAESPLLPVDMVARAIGVCLWKDQSGDDAKPARNAELYIGFDIGRSHDRSVIVTLERKGTRAIVRELVVLRNCPFAKQREELCKRITPNVRKVGIDKGGIGMQLHEEIAAQYGSRIEGYQLNSATQGKVATLVRSVFDRQAITIPDDADLRADLQLIEQCETVSGVPVIKTGRSLAGHGDRAWGLFLALAVMPLMQQRPNIGGMPRAVPLGGAAQRITSHHAWQRLNSSIGDMNN
ncbi:MAG: hypothetical protein SH850_21270 [Planctomycetaceae bacterium]|nr:hypothetical protein [Planctomycetaceae bacterium]